MKNVILNHEIVRIEATDKSHRVFIRLAAGGWLEHNPFPRDLRGLVAAMDLARDCMAGKFFPMAVVQENQRDQRLIGAAVKAIDDMTQEDE